MRLCPPRRYSPTASTTDISMVDMDTCVKYNSTTTTSTSSAVSEFQARGMRRAARCTATALPVAFACGLSRCYGYNRTLEFCMLGIAASHALATMLLPV